MSVNTELSVWQRAAAYAAIGVTTEVIFTGLKVGLTLQGHTQLWVIPLWGFVGTCCFEPLHEKLRDQPLVVRIAAYVLAIFACEYIWGLVTEALIGVCPWRYDSIYAIHGYVNLAYTPYWAGFVVLAERIENFVRSLKAPKVEAPSFLGLKI